MVLVRPCVLWVALLLQVFGLNSLSDILTVPVADLAAATQVRQVWGSHRTIAGHPAAGVLP